MHSKARFQLCTGIFITRSISSAALVFLLFAGSVAVAESEKVTGANYPPTAKFNREFVYQHVQEANVISTFIGKIDQF